MSLIVLHLIWKFIKDIEVLFKFSSEFVVLSISRTSITAM